MKKGTFFLALVFFLSTVIPLGSAADVPLKIQAIPDQRSVKAGMMFLVPVKVINEGNAAAEFWSNSCSYEKHWVTDHSGVFIQAWSCNEDDMEQVTLKTGDAYEKNIILYIPKPEKTGPVIFRLGFKRMGEDGESAEPLWSDPITMQVLVPEGTVAAKKPEGGVSREEKPAADVPEIKKNKAEPVVVGQTAPAVKNSPEEKAVR